MTAGRPHLRLARTVSRSSVTCAHCRHVLAPLDQECAITVGGVALVVFCNTHCAETDARLNKRGPLVTRYLSEAA